jgi:hypothetical protein
VKGKEKSHLIPLFKKGNLLSGVFKMGFALKGTKGGEEENQPNVTGTAS